ncbi:MAG: type II toxin-antitoxin system HicA family toxin [bacterium]|nr:type II toxin-antitoxin system HicA family toxin [bacterium]
MKRRELISYLLAQGCVLLREGAKHSLFMNPLNHSMSTIPRHSEINSFLGHKICRDLGISEIEKQ